MSSDHRAWAIGSFDAVAHEHVIPALAVEGRPQADDPVVVSEQSIRGVVAGPSDVMGTEDPAEFPGWTHPGKVEAPYTVCIASASNLTGLVKSSVECRRTGL